MSTQDINTYLYLSKEGSLHYTVRHDTEADNLLFSAWEGDESWNTKYTGVTLFEFDLDENSMREGKTDYKVDFWDYYMVAQFIEDVLKRDVGACKRIGVKIDE